VLPIPEEYVEHALALRGIKAAENDPLLEVVGHVHDEIICLADEANAETALQRLKEHMARTVEWAPDLLLGASGYVSTRYRKD